MPACLPACLFACLPARLPACLPAECVLVIYSYLSDAAVITQNSTAAFLQALQRWQQAAQPNSTLDVQPFVEVARDMLGYFRLRCERIITDSKMKLCCLC
jgi:hypothetical protein